MSHLREQENRHITVHIERLVLDGLPVTFHERGILQAAFEAELVQLLTTGELSFDLQTGGVRSKVPAGVLALKADDSPSALGKKLARAIYEGIGQ